MADGINIDTLHDTVGKEKTAIKKMIMDSIRRVTAGFSDEKLIQFKRDLLSFEDNQGIAMPYDPNIPVFKELGGIVAREVEIKVGMIPIKSEVEKFRDTYLISIDELDLEEKKFPFHSWFIQTIVEVGLSSLAPLPFQGVHDASGTATLDICDGIHKITDTEKSAGNITVAKGNLFEMLGGATDYDATNIGANLKAQFAKFPALTQESGVECWIPYRYKQMYKDWMVSEYPNRTDGEVDTTYLDGTDKKVKFRWEAQMGSSKKVYMVIPGTFIYGFDKKNKDFGKLQVWNPNPFIVAAVNKIAIGFQIYSLNSKVFNVNNL